MRGCISGEGVGSGGSGGGVGGSPIDVYMENVGGLIDEVVSVFCHNVNKSISMWIHTESLVGSLELDPESHICSSKQ